MRIAGPGLRIWEHQKKLYLHVPLNEGPSAPPIGSAEVAALHRAYDSAMSARARRALNDLAHKASNCAADAASPAKPKRRKHPAPPGSKRADRADESDDARDTHARNSSELTAALAGTSTL